MMELLKKVITFIQKDIWRIRLRNYPASKSFFIKQLRIVLLSIRGFSEDKCKFRASALTFFSLLSIVPVIAMMFGIAKGFGMQQRVETQLLAKMHGQEEIAQRIMAFANSFLENTKGGLVAGIGVALLFYTIIKLLGNIENAFNHIWGVKTSRPLGRKFSDYISVMMVCPILLVMSGSATVLISTQIRNIIENIAILKTVAPLVIAGLRLLPYASLWIIFTFIFIFMPNTKVRFKSGLLAGVVAGTIFQLAQWGYVNFQIGTAKFGAIYGSFAALPLFLIWLQISWLIVLFGAELSFAHQNVDTYEFEQDCLGISYSYKKLLSLLLMHSLVKNFCGGKEAETATELSRKLDIPIRLVRQILFELAEAGIASETNKAQNKVSAYQPARDVEALSIKNVINALENKGNDDIPVVQTAQLKKLGNCLADFSTLIEKSNANILLKDI